MTSKNTYELTEAEWAIIQVIWKKEPCTAPDVQESLEKSKKWTYSTVKTLMDRMVSKGLLKTKKMRNLILYSSVITRPQAQNSEVMKAVKRAFDGSFTPMMQFMLDNNNLSEEQLDELEDLIRQKRISEKQDGK